MKEHPDDCCCADCMPDWPCTRQEVEQQREQDHAEQLEGAGLISLPARG
jgi:hypothetical protein